MPSPTLSSAPPREQAERTLHRTLLGLAVLAPAAYAVTILALAQIAGNSIDWYAEAPKLAMLSLCGVHLFRAGRRSAAQDDVSEHALERARTLVADLEPENRRLAAQLEAVQAAGRARNAFLARMGHHLRTPMNGILATTELALAGDLSADQRDLLATARDSGRALLRAVDHVLDAARIEAGEMTLDKEPTDLHAVVAAALAARVPTARLQHAELACRIAPGVPPLVMGDPERLEQVIGDVLDHALRAAGRGAVVLSLGGDSDLLRIVVSDTGAGLPAGEAERLTQPWTTTEEQGSTGLGPSVAAQIVALMGGTLRLESEVGMGSRFVIDLPVEVPAGPSQAPATPDLSGLSFLVAEARMTSRAVLTETLRGWGARVVAVENGTEAIDALEEARAADRPHHMVLLAEDLPEREAFERDQGPRCGPGDGQLVLVASAPSSDWAGPSVLRPVLPRQLAATLHGALDGSHPDGLATLRREVAGRPLRVLVVEDNPVGRKVAQRLLSSWGHTVWLASDGRQALSMLQSQSVDLVLMDLAMPVMDGLTATRSLRDRERQDGRGHLPVIAMTAHTDRGDRERCLAAGMDGHVAKPIRAEELAAVIHELRGSVLRR